MKKNVIKPLKRNLFRSNLKPRTEQRLTLLGAVLIIILLYGIVEGLDDPQPQASITVEEIK